MAFGDNLLGLPHKKAKPLVDEASLPKPVADLRSLLLEVKGNPELNSRFNWSGAVKKSDKSYIVPPRDPNLPALSIEPNRSILRSKCESEKPVEFNACYLAKEDIVHVLNVQAALGTQQSSASQNTLQEDHPFQRMVFDALDGGPFEQLKQSSSTFHKVYYEGNVAHEDQHAMGPEISDFAAYRRTFDHLANNGEIAHVPRDTILKAVFLSYTGDQFAHSVMDAFKGNIKKARDWLPGGKKFLEAAESLRQAARNELHRADDASINTPEYREAFGQVHYRLQGERGKLFRPNNEYASDLVRGVVRHRFHRVIRNYARENHLTRNEMRELTELCNKRLLGKGTSPSDLDSAVSQVVGDLAKEIDDIRRTFRKLRL